MTTKQTQRWLMGGALALTLAGLGILVCVLSVSIHVPVPHLPDSGGGLAANASLSDGLQGGCLTPQQLQAFAAINLRRPLKDPPPVVVAPIPMQARLLGTIFEPGNPGQSQALFRLADGSQRLFKAGQRFDEPGGVIVIKQVGDQTASVEYRDEQRDLKVEAP